jgi:hypothetical protein
VLCAAVKKYQLDNEAFDRDYQCRCRKWQEGRNNSKDGSSTKKARQSVEACYNDMDDLDIEYFGV